MKYRILLLSLCIVFALSGCSAMLERDYVSAAAHVDYFVTEDESILRAESYQGLVNALLHFMTEHSSQGTIRLYNYTGNVDADLEDATNEVLHEDPLGAYAVQDIRCESTRILTYYEISVTILYSKSASEVAAIRPVVGLSSLRQELTTMVTQYLSDTTVRLSYFSGDTDLVRDLFWLSFYRNPAASFRQPDLEVTFYPEDSSQRILHISVNWHKSPAQLAQYEQTLTLAAQEQMELHPPAGEKYTIFELAQILRSVLTYDPTGSADPLSALQGEPVNDQGTLLALELLCQQSGLTVTPVADTAGAQLWLIVSTPSGYRHLLPRDLRPDPDGTKPGSWELPLYTDEELSALGFEWPTNLHPACVDYSGMTPE